VIRVSLNFTGQTMWELAGTRIGAGESLFNTKKVKTKTEKLKQQNGRKRIFFGR